MPSFGIDLRLQALPGVTRVCPGCGGAFTPTRTTQAHCRPSCRVLALRKRRESRSELFAAVADHVEPDVMP
jgi:hypothetical protein